MPTRPHQLIILLALTAAAPMTAAAQARPRSGVARAADSAATAAASAGVQSLRASAPGVVSAVSNAAAALPCAAAGLPSGVPIGALTGLARRVTGARADTASAARCAGDSTGAAAAKGGPNSLGIVAAASPIGMAMAAAPAAAKVGRALGGLFGKKAKPADTAAAPPPSAYAAMAVAAPGPGTSGLDPNPRTEYGCLRPDAKRTRAAIAAAAKREKAGAPHVEVVEIEAEASGCTYYHVDIASTVAVEDNETRGVTSTISGRGGITFGLAKDNADAGYALTSGVQDLAAPIWWDPASARITRPNCTITVSALPYTLYAFWLGVTPGAAFRMGVRVSPEGSDAHAIVTRCKPKSGRPRDVPSQEVIHSAAWVALHGSAAAGSAAPAAGIDAAAAQALADYVTAHPKATPAEVMAQVNRVAPGVSQAAAQARENFTFTSPGACTQGTDVVAVCTINETVALPSRVGYGSLKTIRMATVITVTQLPPRH